MKPIVAEVEPVAEDATFCQLEIVQFGGASVVISVLVANSIIRPLRVEWAFAELELVHVLFVTVEGVEDRVMELFEALVTADLDDAAYRFAGEFLVDRAAQEIDRQHVKISGRRDRYRRRFLFLRRRNGRGLVVVPGRNLIVGDQNLQRTRLTGVTQD